jgi:hypothetical protein
MDCFHSFLYVYQRVNPNNIPLNHYKIPLNNSCETHPATAACASAFTGNSGSASKSLAAAMPAASAWTSRKMVGLNR